MTPNFPAIRTFGAFRLCEMSVVKRDLLLVFSYVVALMPLGEYM